jgi:hypothetical protein
MSYVRMSLDGLVPYTRLPLCLALSLFSLSLSSLSLTNGFSIPPSLAVQTLSPSRLPSGENQGREISVLWVLIMSSGLSFYKQCVKIRPC